MGEIHCGCYDCTQWDGMVGRGGGRETREGGDYRIGYDTIGSWFMGEDMQCSAVHWQSEGDKMRVVRHVEHRM